MSRRRGEFEHRTSIFEGAFRAWSHLGGLDPRDLESKPTAELDPLTNPIVNDSRKTKTAKSGRREYPYEPLPRAGLAHPYVQAILSPWLGPDADNEAIQLGLTTLRTWWQHRRKGESGSAIAALGTEKMKGVVEGYTRHFFTLAHCLVVNDGEQPPRTLYTRMKELEKARGKSGKKKESGKEGCTAPNSTSTDPINGPINSNVRDSNLSSLERLRATQQMGLDGNAYQNPTMPIIDMKGKCVPGKVDLPDVVQQVNRASTQLAYRGGPNNGFMGEPSSDPNTVPVVFVSSNGDIQIAMSIDGMTCAHCVKIVETVLKGCNGNKSPIDGLIDAAADEALSSVIIKIDKASNAKRIASEATRNLAMVGYTAKVKEMGIVGEGADKKATMDLGALSTAFDVVATTESADVFDWTLPCSCPDNGVVREDCARHSQMNTRIFDAFSTREEQVKDYMAGCGMKYGMACTCGPSCRCANCPMHRRNGTDAKACGDSMRPVISELSRENLQLFDEPLGEEQNMDFFGMESPSPNTTVPILPSETEAPMLGQLTQQQTRSHQEPRSQRNPSITRISFGHGLRHLSMTSEGTFGRAMSGLSALSIDWENLDDFDVEVDHSAHINNAPKDHTGHRSSIRRSFLSTIGEDGGITISFATKDKSADPNS